MTAAALRHPALDTVLTLDPTAAGFLSRLGPARAVPVPDPAPPEPVVYDRESVRSELGVEDGRRMAALLGGLDGRKGALTTLRAVLDLPADAAARLCVVLWGRVHEAVREPFEALRAEAEGGAGAQVVVRDAFVPTDRIQSVVATSDVLLLPYDRHVGSSGFLVRAAAAGVPVLSQDYGLMGHLVRTHRLGRTADTSAPEPLARALADAARDPGTGFDRASAVRFAHGHTAEAFAAPFLDALDAS